MADRSTNSEVDQLSKLKDLVDEVKICSLVTQSGNDKKLSARPMSTAKVEEDGVIWFFTNEFSGKVNEISHDSEVLLAYASPAKNSYLNVIGKASVSQDKAKMQELWNPILKAWFPEGLDDPKLALISVTPREAEYWDGSSSKLVVAFGMLKAALTGGKYNEGEHGKISL